MTRPLIGITLDFQASGGYSVYPWYALRCNYFEAIAHAGGIPVAIPYHIDLIESILDRLQGLIIPGGSFDIPPRRYGATETHEKVVTKEERTHFDEKIAVKALERNIPFLGICAGAQLINVVCGGTLYQHIPDEIDNALEHEQKNPRTEPSHPIEIHPASLLHQIGSVTEAMVNSSHHQAVKDLGKGVTATAWAPDGVIEAIEIPEKKFCMGIEWHPEYEITDLDRKIFQHLVKEAQTA